MIHVCDLLRTLLDRYGPQRWWPADGPFEIMVGALLVQRTTWANVEVAIAKLRSARLLDCEALAAAHAREVEPFIRSVGFHRVKSSRLVGLANYVCDSGGIAALGALSRHELERSLLGVPGIGKESAAAILLYAFDRPVWVPDAYSRRILTRIDPHLGSVRAEQDFVSPLERDGDDVALKELHALLVEHGKRHCLARPRCSGCALSSRCAQAH